MSYCSMRSRMSLNLSLLKSSALFLIGGGRRKRLQLQSLILCCILKIIIQNSISMKGYNSPKHSTSLAAKYGVTTKENNSLGSMGLNPNLNIEDEYIENLLKQIHFMSLEIKLIKEKQAKSEGNALWGVINRTGQPYISNIVESSKKYDTMKKETSNAISKLQKEITCLANEQGAILAEINFLESKRQELKARTQDWIKENHSKHQIFNEKICQQKQRLEYLNAEIKQEEEKNRQLITTHQTIINEETAQKDKGMKEATQIANDEKIEELMEKDKQESIDILKASITKLQELFAENVEYLKAKQDQQALKQKICNLDKGIASANFEIMQLLESIKMSDQDREKQIRQRKKITEDFQLTKVMLLEILAMNSQRKQKQSDSKKRSSPEIWAAEEQRQKLQKNLQETKAKLVKAEELHQKMKTEVDGYNRNITNEKEKQQLFKKKYAELVKDNDLRQSQLINLNNQVRTLQDQCDKVLYDETNTSLDLFQLEKEMEFLKARRELLQESMELKEVMNGLKVQDLQRVVQKNNDLNDTVATLMSKWDEIKSFSRI